MLATIQSTPRGVMKTRRFRSARGATGLTALAVALALVAPLGARAQASGARASAPRNVQKTLFGLENEWTKALVVGDTAAFRRLTVPGFIYTEDNVVMTQDELINAIATSTDRIESAGNEQMRLHDYSPVAVVTGMLVVKGKSKGKSFTNRYRFTDTWLYRNGKWRAIAAHDYLIPK